MPEGHTVHRLARDLGVDLQGRPLRASSPQGRFTAQASRLDGTVLHRAEAYGKHLFLAVSSGDHVHVHLGLQGKWLRSADPAAPALRQVRLRLATAAVAWDLIAPARCELLDDMGMTAVVDKLGPDPLRRDADPDTAIAALQNAPGAIGAALLDQSVVAGVGNVFRSEALHAVGIAPARPCRALSAADARSLWWELRRMMARAVEDGRIITVDSPDRLSLPEADARKVYKQTNCRDCGAPVVTSTVGGRTAYHCPREQPD